MYTRYIDIPPYPTKDGSEIRELMHPDHAPCRNQSLAEARVPPGERTRLHQHHTTEELYHITAGRGVMTLGDQNFPVQRGDTVCIPPGTPHCIANAADDMLVLLCCCSPPYRHDDTELVGS